MNISSKHCLSQTFRARELSFWENVHPALHVTCPISHVMCHVSHVTCLPRLVLTWVNARITNYSELEYLSGGWDLHYLYIAFSALLEARAEAKTKISIKILKTRSLVDKEEVPLRQIWQLNPYLHNLNPIWNLNRFIFKFCLVLDTFQFWHIISYHIWHISLGDILV